MWDVAVKWWAPAWAAISTVCALLMALAAKTYAKHDRLLEVDRRLSTVETRLESIPSREEIAELRRDISELNGAIKGLQSQMIGLSRIVDLIIESKINKQ